jgi:hypothetical protein
MAGWYHVVKTIKGHRYLYAQRTWREGGHVRTQSRYIGKAGDGGTASSSGKAAEAGLSDTEIVYRRGTLASDGGYFASKGQSTYYDPEGGSTPYLLKNANIVSSDTDEATCGCLRQQAHGLPCPASCPHGRPRGTGY